MVPTKTSDERPVQMILNADLCRATLLEKFPFEIPVGPSGTPSMDFAPWVGKCLRTENTTRALEL